MRERNRERFKELREHAEVVTDCGDLRRLSKQIAQIIDVEIAQLKKQRKKPHVNCAFAY
jgi:hypothetical protein